LFSEVSSVTRFILGRSRCKGVSPSLDASLVGNLSKDGNLSVNSARNGWANVSFSNGVRGWVEIGEGVEVKLGKASSVTEVALLRRQAYAPSMNVIKSAVGDENSREVKLNFDFGEQSEAVESIMLIQNRKRMLNVKTDGFTSRSEKDYSMNLSGEKGYDVVIVNTRVDDNLLMILNLLFMTPVQ